MRISDWSSDVCSSDLAGEHADLSADDDGQSIHLVHPKTPAPGRPIDLKREIETIELEQIHVALDLADSIISEAARLLSLKRTTLIEKMRSEEHTSELQSLMRISYAVFCLKKQKLD